MTSPVALWRIAADTPTYEAHDLSGKGAELSGGRWNRPGTPMVYASISRALACLETLAHLARTPLPLNRYLVRVDVPDAIWAQAVMLDGATAVGWDAEPTGKVSLDWGDAWAKSVASVVAIVPSVIVPEEPNALVNPAHPDATQLRATKIRRWLFDGRLI